MTSWLFDGRRSWLLVTSGVFLLAACARSPNDVTSGAGGRDGTGGSGGSAASGTDASAGSTGGAAASDSAAADVGADDQSSDGGAIDEAVGPPESPRPARPAFDWMGIVGTGQSLAVGNLGVPVNTFDSVFHNLKISLGKGNNAPPFDPNDASLSVVPLTEPIRALVPLANYPSAYPANIFGETPHSFMADQISTLYAPWNQGEYVTVHSVVGESGQGIAVIGKGAPDTGHTGRAYAATLFEVKAITRLAKAAGKTYGVGAIIFTHGEQDATNKTYGAAVHQLWSDYNTDLAAITGQTTSIPMLLTQQHSAPFTAGSAADSTQAAWQLGVMYPGDFICAGPKYQYQYQSEGRHLTTPGYDRLGAKYAQVYYQAIALGQHWQPLQPKSVMKSGKTITIDFNVPVAPLNWDENILPPHQTTLTEWAKGRGFEVRNASGRATIDSVAIVGSTVVLTLAADSQASGWVVGYATVQDDAGMMAGPTRGRRGQLRDSDPFVAVDAQTIACTVTNGSAQIQARTPGAFRTREGRDLAAGVGLKPETIVLTKTSDSAMTLSQPWTGASGTADIDFRNDQRNYCVSFEMPVP